MSALAIPANTFALKVLTVKHYTERLFHFEVERPQGFRFRTGEFVMITLPGAKPVWRAYSLASPAWSETVEFFSIKVPDGPLTGQLQKMQVGDTIWMRSKPTGTLVIDRLVSGKRLYFLSTGTGIAPFAGLIRDPDVYEKFEHVVLVHTTREVAELAYGHALVSEVLSHEFLGEMARGRLHHYATTTRESSERMGRVTDLISSGEFPQALGFPALSPAEDRVMVCGSMAMVKELGAMLEERGFEEGSASRVGTYVYERAFVG